MHFFSLYEIGAPFLADAYFSLLFLSYFVLFLRILLAEHSSFSLSHINIAEEEGVYFVRLGFAYCFFVFFGGGCIGVKIKQSIFILSYEQTDR